MNSGQLSKTWGKKYQNSENALNRLAEAGTVASAFNANIDAVLNISGSEICALIEKFNLSWNELNHVSENKLHEGRDVLKGIFKSFSRGIAEEWLTEDKKVYDWMVENLGYTRLQMGGQGGIVANALAAAGVKKVVAHTNSLPKTQAKQFLACDNLFSFDEKGEIKPAYQIDRKNDVPLIHWIIEFQKGDKFCLEGHEVVCPKSNRFIATYDPLNLNLVRDEAFVSFMTYNPVDYVVLSGFHALTANNRGCELLDEVLPYLDAWKKQNPNIIVHLEIASTQDIKVRESIVKKVADKVESIGLNEREAIEVLEIIGEEKLADECDKACNSVQLFKALTVLKEKIKAPRIQLHMYGLYMTMQDKGFRITPEQNLRGMILAATAAAGKASLGKIEKKEDFVAAKGQPVTDEALNNLRAVADFIGDEKLAETGISQYKGYDLIAIPTILVDKPVTLVGMGDTISSISLVGSR